MIRVKQISNACPRCQAAIDFITSSPYSSRSSAHVRAIQPSLRNHISRPYQASTRSFTTLNRRQQGPPSQSSIEDLEKVVRDAKQRFRDTLPRGYLNDDEYALYERLYGPPLRETVPEDVGIPTHADMDQPASRPPNEGVLLKELEDGEFEEVTYEIIRDIEDVAAADGAESAAAEKVVEPIEKPPGYVESIARSQREHDALQKLYQDFQTAQRGDPTAEAEAGRSTLEGEGNVEEEGETSPSWLPEEARRSEERMTGEEKRFHPWTLEGRFHDSPVELLLPEDELILPIRTLLSRTHKRHVKEAAEEAFGGEGLPNSPATPDGRKDRPMEPVGLPPGKRHMTEIEADAFLAGYMPPMYASVTSVLREVRRRVGSEWLQSRLKSKAGAGINVLDAGAGGAGLIAWDEIVRAEWDLLKDSGEVRGEAPKGRKTVVAASDRLRQRLKTFLDNTTFLPRLPDYEHSGDTRGEKLDGGGKPQVRKRYDIIIASHLLLQETQDHYRQAILNNLWSLLSKDGGVLIVLEKGNPRGFEAVAHVRDTVLNKFLLPNSGQPVMATTETNPAFERELEPGHVIAPCTNQGACPMYREPGKSTGRRDFCHFPQRFVRPAFYHQILGRYTETQGEVSFSYVAIQRGVAKEEQASGKDLTQRAFEGYDDADTQPDMQTLPRIVMPSLKRKGHVTMDLCTPEGKLERWTIPKSYGKLAYHDARKSRWGDLWALGAKTRVVRPARSGKVTVDKEARAAERKKRRHPGKGADGAVTVSATERAEANRRKPKSKHRELVQEMLRAEKLEEEALSREIDEDVEDRLDYKKMQREQGERE